jgi:hypothetical protein
MLQAEMGRLFRPKMSKKWGADEGRGGHEELGRREKAILGDQESATSAPIFAELHRTGRTKEVFFVGLRDKKPSSK